MMLIASKVHNHGMTVIHRDDHHSHRMAATTPIATAPSISTTEHPADIATRPEDKYEKKEEEMGHKRWGLSSCKALIWETAKPVVIIMIMIAITARSRTSTHPHLSQL